jgi:signal transduction histidine kinase
MRCLLVLLLFSSTFSFAQKSEVLSNGVFRIDSLPVNGIVLDKGWKWQAGDHPDFAKSTFDDSKWASIDPTKDIMNLPELWKTDIGWIRLRFKVDSSLIHKSMAILIQQTGASEIFINGQLIEKFGEINTKTHKIKAATPINGSFIGFLIQKKEEQVLTVRFAIQKNISYLNFAQRPNIALSLRVMETSATSLVIENNITSYFDFLRFGLYLILSILHFTLFWFNKSQKNNLYFFLYAFLSTIYNLLIGLVYNQISFASTKMIFLFTTAILTMVANMFFLTAVYSVFNRQRSFIYWILSVYSLVGFVLLFTNYQNGFDLAVNFPGILILLESVRITFSARRKKQRGSNIIILGAVSYLAFYALFHLFVFRFLPVGPKWIYGHLAFNLSFLSLPIAISIYLALEASFTARTLIVKLAEVETLSEEKQQILATQNEVLEGQVNERTAELQFKNRELEIEAALERVRSASLAIHQSHELEKVVLVLFDKLKELSVPFDSAFIYFFEKSTRNIEAWVATKLLPAPIKVNMPYDESVANNPIIVDLWYAIENGEHGLNKSYKEKDKDDYYRYEAKHNQSLIPASVTDLQLEAESWTTTFAAEKNSIVGFDSWDGHLTTIEDFQLLKRFAKVFEQAYIRFLDLQKAEAQARESQIEAALERVRSRTMAMQYSNELAEAANLMSNEVRGLGIPIWSCGYNIFEKDEKSCIGWMSTEGSIQPSFRIPLKVSPTFIKFYESRQNGEELYEERIGGDDLVTHYNYMLTLPNFAEILKGFFNSGHRLPTFQVNTVVNFSQGNLIFISTEPIPEAHEIFRRFAKVFEQTYTRFLDLQKAEINEHEAIRQASLDRVRAEIASMRTKNDLQRITPLIWKELTTLAVPFIRCGVFIMDEANEKVHTYLSTPDGRAIASFDLPYVSPGITPEVVAHWRNRQRFSDHWDEAQFRAWSQSLVDQGLIQSEENYVSEAPPKQLSLYFLPFRQGMLYVGNGTPLSDDEIELAQVLADAFSTAYARYQDFNELEETKLQVEKAFSELKSTQTQLIQKEKMASLGELTAGIAHEIQNPLNFVNNFSELSTELIDEMNEEIEKGDTQEVKAIAEDLKQNLEKINHHGKRASSIVKGMLEHSRTGTGERQLTDLNQLADEYLRLSYHGLRAKDNTFNADYEFVEDKNLPKINVVPQEIGRVLLNLINNAFYAVNERSKLKEAGFQPKVTVTTQLINSQVKIAVQDNGMGMSATTKVKIFQPFFTTKPTGEGTGLGLSLAYDIVTKGHGGEIEVESVEGEGTTFTVCIPCSFP